MQMKYLYFFFCCLVSSFAYSQQTGQTENYLLNKLGTNSALASIDQEAHVTALGQYGPANCLGSLKNYYFAAEIPLMKSFGLALQYSSNSFKLADSKTVTLGIAKHIDLGDKLKISLGVNGGYSNTEFDFTSDYGISLMKKGTVDKSTSIISGPNGPMFSQNSNNFKQDQYLLGAGVFLNSDTWHVGFSVPNLVKNTVPNYMDPSKTVVLERPAFLSVQKDLKLNKKFSLTTGGLYRFSKINPAQRGLDLQASLWLNEKYSLGFWYQRIGAKQASNMNESKPLVIVTETIINKLRLGYAFNFSNNPSNFTNIKQQVMLRIDIDYLKKKPKI
jgi:type IX secretion system PorP/SprF family membrane protein